MNRELVAKATEYKPCTTIGKNLKCVIPAKQIRPHIPCVEPNQEMQIDFVEPSFDEKGNEVYFLASIDYFSKYPTASIIEKANGPKVLKFLTMSIKIRAILALIDLTNQNV